MVELGSAGVDDLVGVVEVVLVEEKLGVFLLLIAQAAGYFVYDKGETGCCHIHLPYLYLWVLQLRLIAH